MQGGVRGGRSRSACQGKCISGMRVDLGGRGSRGGWHMEGRTPTGGVTHGVGETEAREKGEGGGTWEMLGCGWEKEGGREGRRGGGCGDAEGGVKVRDGGRRAAWSAFPAFLSSRCPLVGSAVPSLSFLRVPLPPPLGGGPAASSLPPHPSVSPGGDIPGDDTVRLWGGGGGGETRSARRSPIQGGREGL